MRQDDPDPVPAPQTETSEAVGELLGLGFEFGKGQGLTLPRGIFKKQRGLFGPHRMPVTDVHTHVVILRDPPMEIPV